VETKTRGVTLWKLKHCGLHDWNYNTVDYMMESITLWVIRWEQKNCGLHRKNYNTVG
jgi:hypothetical protein